MVYNVMSYLALVSSDNLHKKSFAAPSEQLKEMVWIGMGSRK